MQASSWSRIRWGLVLALAAVFAWISYDVVAHGPLWHLDHRVRDFVVDHGAATGRRWLSWSTWPGSPYAAVLVLAGAAFTARRLGARRRVWLHAAALLVTLVAVVIALKLGFDRPSPIQGGASEPWGVFPSGHTTTAVVAWGGTASILVPRLPRGPARWWLLALAVLVPIEVGLALVALAYHWLADVLAGWALGPLLLLVLNGARRPASPRRNPDPRVRRTSEAEPIG